MMDLALVSALRSQKLWACSKLRQDEASGAMFVACCLLFDLREQVWDNIKEAHDLV